MVPCKGKQLQLFAFAAKDGACQATTGQLPVTTLFVMPRQYRQTAASPWAIGQMKRKCMFQLTQYLNCRRFDADNVCVGDTVEHNGLYTHGQCIKPHEYLM